MPASIDLLFSNGLERLRQGDLAGAEALFDQARRAFPGDPVAPVLLGMARLSAGDFVQAEARFRQALALDPDQPKVCIHLAHALRMQGRPAEAVKFCKVTVAAEPDNFDAGLELARALEESDDLAGAEAAYRHILERETEPFASLGLGAMLNRMGRSQDAEAVLRRALERRDA